MGETKNIIKIAEDDCIGKIALSDLTVKEYELLKKAFKKHNITDTKGRFGEIAFYTKQLMPGYSDPLYFDEVFKKYLLPIIEDEGFDTKIKKDLNDLLPNPNFEISNIVNASDFAYWDEQDKNYSTIDQAWLQIQDYFEDTMLYLIPPAIAFTRYAIICHPDDANLVKYTLDKESNKNLNLANNTTIYAIDHEDLAVGTCYLIQSNYTHAPASIAIDIYQLTAVYYGDILTDSEYNINIALGMLTTEEYELLDKTIFKKPLACPKDALPYVIYHAKNFLREHPAEDFEDYYFKYLFKKALDFKGGIPNHLEDHPENLVTLELFILGTEHFNALIDFRDLLSRRNTMWKDIAPMFDDLNAKKLKLPFEYHRYSIICHHEDVDLILDIFDEADSKNICIANNTLNIGKIAEQNLKKGNIYITQSNFRFIELIKQFPLYLE